MKKIELLAPAGDFDAIKAAVYNGANAVYVGCQQFSARQNATNFSQEELEEVVSYCHVRNVKVYLALNTLVFNSQLNDVVQTIKNACSISVDALIVQDLGIISIIKEICPTMPIHASTQMAVHTKQGAQLLSTMGIKRVVLARELSLAEITDITTNVDIEVEVFVHGALCMSLSGQCYISGMIGGRSGNRGNCAGTCRLPFSSDQTKEQYALSLKDNCLVEHIDNLKTANVCSLKIEGRMKRPEYVAAATEVYRNAIDGTPYDIDQLKAIFSRDGFTDAYLQDNISANMYGYRRKKDVVSATPKLLKEIENSYRKEIPLIALSFNITLKQDEPTTLTAVDSDGNTATVTGDIPQTALTSPATIESLSRSLSKLGGTPFFMTTLNGSIQDGLMLPASAINEMRRNICAEITATRATCVVIPCADWNCTLEKSPPRKPKLYARFASFSQLIDGDFAHIMLPISEVTANLSKLEPLKDKLIIEPDRLMLKTEQQQADELKSLYQKGYRHLLCSNIAHIKLGTDIGYTLHGDTFLNCINTPSTKLLEQLGVAEITLSFEGALKELSTIQSNVPLGIIAYGYLPLMVMKSCPIKAQLDCSKCTTTLIDRLNTEFKVYCHNKKYIEILNSTPLYLADRQHELSFDFLTLYFTTESTSEINQIVTAFKQSTPNSGSFTRGLYYRTI